METITVELQVNPNALARRGVKSIQESMQQRLNWEDLQEKALNYKAFLDEHGLDFDEIAEEARAIAWERYKTTVLKDILSND
jgi:hypothetical protein